jgi:hypothetical protein
MESRSVSQVFEIQRRIGKVADPQGHNAKQSCIHVDLRGIQVGMPEVKTQIQPFCVEGEAFY